MPCVSPDGKPTESGMKILGAIKAGSTSADEIAAASGMPLYRVRSGMRDLAEAGFVTGSEGSYALTEEGAAVA